MTQARASHLRLVQSEPTPAPLKAPRMRFKPVVRLADGAAFGLHVETDITFEDTFRPRHLSDAALPNAVEWLGDMIERACRLADDANAPGRPISITAPVAALADPDLAMACEAGVRRTRLLPQEVRIDFPDVSVSSLEEFALDRLDAVRKRGFRVGLDARRSWRTPLNARARLTFEAIRLSPDLFEQLEIPASRLEIAAADGVALIAENARWRDAEKLAQLGIHFALAPRADS
jgi:hypothetical protein